MSAFSALTRRVLYEFYYRFRRPRWDTGITPPEVVELVEREGLPRGRALDVGCGTGTNVIYLAQHGFDVVGLDFVPLAIEKARRKARAAGVTSRLLVANVLEPCAFEAPFDFVLDIGCFHNFDGPDRARYVQNLVRWTHPGAHYLVYAFFPRVANVRRFGVSPEDMARSLTPGFRLLSSTVHPGNSEQDSAWYHWQAVEASGANRK